MRVDRVAGGDDGGGGLGEDHRVLRHVLAVRGAGGVEPALGELGGVFGVVPADAEHVAVRGDRGEQFAALGGGAGAQSAECGLAAGDDLLQLAHWGAGVTELHGQCSSVRVHGADDRAVLTLNPREAHETSCETNVDQTEMRFLLVTIG